MLINENGVKNKVKNKHCYECFLSGHEPNAQSK